MIVGQLVLYFVEVDHGTTKADPQTVRWAFLGNKIQSFTSEESAMRMFEDLTGRTAFYHTRWDDSEAKLTPDYQGQKMQWGSFQVEIIDLTDMLIARHTTLRKTLR
jgi:hypothetical protein